MQKGALNVGLQVSKKWLNKFLAYKKLESIMVGYGDHEHREHADVH